MCSFGRKAVECPKVGVAFNAREAAVMYPVFDRHQTLFCCRHFADDDREWDELNRSIWVGLHWWSVSVHGGPKKYATVFYT